MPAPSPNVVPVVTPTPSPTVAPDMATPSPTVAPTATPIPTPTVVALPTPDPSLPRPWWVRRQIRAPTVADSGFGHGDTCETVDSLHARDLLGAAGSSTSFLDWAADESLLVFDVDDTIATVNTAGTDARIVADANPRRSWIYGHHADVSPDGSRIVYATCEFPFPYEDYEYPPVHEVAIVNVDGTGLQRLTIDGRFTAYPAWSPDGSRIAFIRTEPPHTYLGNYFYNYFGHPRNYDPLELQIVTLSVKGPLRVPGTKGVGMYPPVWSPNGERLAFLVNQPAEGEKDPYRPKNPYKHVLFDRSVPMVRGPAGWERPRPCRPGPRTANASRSDWKTRSTRSGSTARTGAWSWTTCVRTRCRGRPTAPSFSLRRTAECTSSERTAAVFGNWARRTWG